MKLNKRNIQLAWKYRGMLWKHRNAIRRRKQIGGIAAAAGAVALGTMIWKWWGGRAPASPVATQ